MYPNAELNLLAVHKAALRGRIHARRWECAEQLARATQPLELVDRARDWWLRLSPLFKMAALPLAFALKRSLWPRRRMMRALLRWSPWLFSALREFIHARRAA